MNFSLAQKESYSRQGFLIIPDFVSSDQCNALISEAEKLVRDFQCEEPPTAFSTQRQKFTSNEYFLNSGDKIRFFFEPGALNSEGTLFRPKQVSINKIGHALHDLNPVFSRFSRQPDIESVCQSFGPLRPLLAQSMYIFKQPKIGGEVICHQDSCFLYTEPMNLLGLWFALQDATLQNGCLVVLPGGHRSGLKRRFRKDEKGGVVFDELDLSPWPDQGYIPLEVKKGTLILLHGLLPHLSGPNTSEHSRHAYTLHLIDESAAYPSDNWLHRSPNFPMWGFESKIGNT